MGWNTPQGQSSHHQQQPSQGYYPPIPSLSEPMPPPSAPPMSEWDQQQFQHQQQRHGHMHHHQQQPVQSANAQAPAPGTVMVAAPTIEAQPWVRIFHDTNNQCLHGWVICVAFADAIVSCMDIPPTIILTHSCSPVLCCQQQHARRNPACLAPVRQAWHDTPCPPPG